jgi:hypothetical protein
MSVEDLNRFVGRWETSAVAPWAEGLPPGETVFEWLDGGPLLVQRLHIPVPEAPDLIAVIADDPERGGLLQHYFDSRGVVRLYRMTLRDRVWTLSRTEPDFSPLDFSQRFTGVFGDDGDSIAGRWEIAHEPDAWQLDFELNYKRLS